MIYDTLNNLPNYLGVSDNLDTVIEYIMARLAVLLPYLLSPRMGQPMLAMCARI